MTRQTYNPPPPRWIDRALYLAALLACLAALAVVSAGWQPLPEPAGGRIADRIYNLNGRPVREHCTTCHPQGRLAGGAAHPPIAPHRSDLLGCTACHLGEGMALDPEISHGLPGSGARRILAGHDLQGRCYVCHDLQPMPGAELAWEGAQLFRLKACNLCHRLTDGQAGGYFGPDLGDIGNQLGLDRLRAVIREPLRILVTTTMPRFPLSPRQIDALALFLKSRVADPVNRTPLERRLQSRDVTFPVAAGQQPLERFQCLACHRFGERDGRIAPDLSYIADQRTITDLRAFVTDPDAVVRDAIMPLPAMNAHDRLDLVTFLEERARGPVTLRDPRKLYMQLCQRCHAADGSGHGLIEPNLANFPRPFFGNVPFFRRVSDSRLRSSLQDGVPGTAMPPYGRLLNEKQREALLDLLFERFIGISRTDKAQLQPLPARPSRGLPTADAAILFRQLCKRCHGADGSGWGPDSPGLRPRPRNFGNRRFMAAASDWRLARAIADGVPGTAMAGFRGRLSGPQLWALVPYLRHFAGASDD